MQTLLEGLQETTFKYAEQIVLEKAMEKECIMAVEKSLSLLDKKIEYFQSKKKQEISTQAFSFLTMGSKNRIEAYSKIFSLQEITELTASILNQVNDCLQGDKKLGEISINRLNLQGLNTVDDLLLNLKKTLFIKDCSRKLNGLAWEKALSSLELSVVGKRALKKYSPHSYMTAELSANERNRIVNLIAAALTGVLDNMLVDLKRQLREQIVNQVYGMEAKVTVKVIQLQKRTS